MSADVLTLTAPLTEGVRVPADDDDSDRDRIDLRVSPDLYRRIREASVAVFGKQNISGYLRMAVLERLARDESRKPPTDN